MNNREQALKLRVHKLEQQTAIQKLTFDRLLADLEMTESVGCALVWDYEAAHWEWREREGKLELLHCYEAAGICDHWDAAVEAGSNFQAAKKWLRDQVRTDATFRKTAVEAAGKNPDLELETPFGRYSIRLLSAT